MSVITCIERTIQLPTLGDRVALFDFQHSC